MWVMLKKTIHISISDSLSAFHVALISRLWWTSFSPPLVIWCVLMQRIELLWLLLCVFIVFLQFQTPTADVWRKLMTCLCLRFLFFSIHIAALSFMRPSPQHLTRLEIWSHSLTQIGIKTFCTHLRQCDMQLTCKICCHRTVCRRISPRNSSCHAAICTFFPS